MEYRFDGLMESLEGRKDMRFSNVLLAAAASVFFIGEVTAEQTTVPSTVSGQAQDYIGSTEVV